MRNEGDKLRHEKMTVVIWHTLLQRPVVVAGRRAAIGRPPEAVLTLLR
jgi:arsenate reductase-like glutaredoxin family protein